MSDELIACLITGLITIFITILGFIVTYNMNKRNYKEELNNNKKIQNIEKLQDVIASVIEQMNDPSKVNTENWKKIVTNIIAYGSSDAIKIITYLQRNLYKLSHTPLSKEENTVFMLTTYSLLITQIKYDLTGEILPPLTYLKIRLTDFEKLENEYYIKNNEIIDELTLNPDFKTL